MRAKCKLSGRIESNIGLVCAHSLLKVRRDDGGPAAILDHEVTLRMEADC